MQIVRITSNDPSFFGPIEFNFGDKSSILNVIYGDVRKPQDTSRDSHNLGKTTLIAVIDFLFLGKIDKSSLFIRHLEIFSDLELYIELYISKTEYIGIRRGIADHNQVSLTKSSYPLGDMVNSSDIDWQHPALSLTAARQMLDGWLDIQTLGPYTYRKAITYFLRSQRDWDDELQLRKFALGADRDWKPFVGLLFGFDQQLLNEKYTLDSEVEKLHQEAVRLGARTAFSEQDLTVLQAELLLLESSVNELEQRLDGFEFDQAEQQLITSLVEDIETEIAQLNEAVYNARYDISQIEQSLNHRDKFDLKKAAEIFEEAQIAFPDGLKKSFEDLLAFRKKITSERNRELRKRMKDLEEKIQSSVERLHSLDLRRQRELKIVESHDTLEKFKVLQRELALRMASLRTKELEVEALQELVNTRSELRRARRTRDAVVDDIRSMVQQSTDLVREFQRTFNDYCVRVLDKDGIFSFAVNEAGNLTYEIGLGFANRGGRKSAQGEGTSYRKLVCALFDLALLKVHSNERFFEFVYHDGVLEGLDDRRKISYLELVREELRGQSLQYILTAISDDRPHAADGRPIEFSESEIVLALHDGGPEGRLFRGPPF